MASKSDLAAIQERNNILIGSIQHCTHTLFEERARARPQAVALHALETK